MTAAKTETEQFYADVACTANVDIGYWTSKALTAEEAKLGVERVIADTKHWASKDVQRALLDLDAGDIDGELADIIAQYARHGEIVYG